MSSAHFLSKSTRWIILGVSTSNLASCKSIFSSVPYFQIQRRNMFLASSFSCPPPGRPKHEFSSQTPPSLYPKCFLNLIPLAAAAQIAKTQIADSSISRHVVRWHPKARSLDKTIFPEESRAATCGYVPSRSRRDTQDTASLRLASVAQRSCIAPKNIRFVLLLIDDSVKFIYLSLENRLEAT